MKKTLVALAVAAFATSASALTVYENEGSKVDLDGQIRLRLSKESVKQDGKRDAEGTQRGHSNLYNNGSRFGVSVRHTLSDDLYALGRVEFRFDDKKGTTDRFGTLYTKQAYVGFGSKQYGELTFGSQSTLNGDVPQSGFDNYYGTFDGTLTDEGKSVVKYVYKGIEGLSLGLDYRFAEKRDDRNEVKEGEQKSGYGVAAIYNMNLAEGQSLTLASGYSRDNFKSEASEGHVKHHKDAWQVGAKYTVDALTLAADYAGSFKKEGKETTRFNGFRVGAKYQVTPAVAVYGNFGRGVEKEKFSGTTTQKVVHNRFMLGTSYQVHKNVFTYLEGGFGSKKTTTDMGSTKIKGRSIAVGLNVTW